MSTTTKTRERPILFSGPLVRAILAGRKTQTRRIVKTGPGITAVDDLDGERWPGYMDECREWKRLPCPYGVPGDRLWVRETFDAPPGSTNRAEVVYRADYERDEHQHTWWPSIYMPRWASRITLEITGVRVERVQEISEADAFDEGVSLSAPDEQTYRWQFAVLWNAINGKDSWESNPWVWVIEFRRVNTPTGGGPTR